MTASQQDNPTSNSTSPHHSQSSTQHSSPDNDHQRLSRINRSTSNRSSQSDQSLNDLEYNGQIRATWTGKIFIITGLRPHQYPQSNPTANGSRVGLKRKRGQSDAATDDPTPNASQASSRHAQDSQGSDHDAVLDPSPTKRRRRRRKSEIRSQLASRLTSPVLPMLEADQDVLGDIDLPAAFLSSSPSPEPDEPDDEAQKLYRQFYQPLTQATPFITAMTKFNPAQRSTENLYALSLIHI